LSFALAADAPDFDAPPPAAGAAGAGLLFGTPPKNLRMSCQSDGGVKKISQLKATRTRAGVRVSGMRAVGVGVGEVSEVAVSHSLLVAVTL
jgi:hypothetical protein